MANTHLFPREPVCWMVVLAVHLIPTGAMAHVVDTLRFTRPFRIHCLFLLLHDIRWPCGIIMCQVSSVTKGYLKQYRIHEHHRK
jgi:hypothetical protein